MTLLMGFGSFMVFRKTPYLPCAILCGVWLFHILHFAFGVKKYTPLDRAAVEQHGSAYRV